MESGRPVSRACGGVGISRSGDSRLRVASVPRPREADPAEREILSAIPRGTAAPPCWGDRRVWAWLVHREGVRINNKRVYRVMKQAGLRAKPVIPAACRTPKAKPQADRPRPCWGIDLTQVLIPALGWVSLGIVWDGSTKKIGGWDLALRSRRQEWQAALDRALRAEFPHGVRGAGLKLISDHGSQPTSTGFMATCAT